MGYCRICRGKWKSKGAAHCTAKGCHRTFRSVGGFIKHRKDGVCKDPADLGMVLKDDFWITPMSDELKIRLGYSKEMAS